MNIREVITQMSLCDKAVYFFTGTLDQTKYDRTNLNKYHEDFTCFLRKYRRNSGCGDIQFLLVPELHSDGKTWHIHGFLKGLPVDYGTHKTALFVLARGR